MKDVKHYACWEDGSNQDGEFFDAVRLSDYQQLEQQVRKLREALRFYAERDIYPLPIMEIAHFEIFRDCGSRARAALKESE